MARDGIDAERVVTAPSEIAAAIRAYLTADNAETEAFHEKTDADQRILSLVPVKCDVYVTLDGTIHIGAHA